jgi:hypothetical protein
VVCVRPIAEISRHRHAIITGMLRLAVILFCVLGCSPACAQAIVKLWDPAYVSVRPGASVEVMVIAEVRAGYVVIAHEAEDKTLQPLTLRFSAPRQTVAGTPGAVVGTPRYPPGQETRVDADQRKVLAHGGRLQIAVPVSVSKQAAPGELTLQGELRYQACVELRCSATRMLPVKLTLDVLPGKG